MLPSNGGSKLLRALWQRSFVSPLPSCSLPSLPLSPRPFISSRFVSLARQPARPAACVRCCRPLPHLIAPFSTSTSTSTTPASYTATTPPSAARTPTSPPPPPPRRPPGSYQSSASDDLRDRNRRLMQYVAAVAIFALGASYAAVPLYRLFCQHTGYGGTTQRTLTSADLTSLAPSTRTIDVTFTADTSPALHWTFKPSQQRLTLRLGEPTLAFYRATNHRDRAITGVATYNVTPMKTGLYFHKVQCFCFDEQRLRAGETVDMPVMFYIDPAMDEDRRCADVKHITLSYTFFPMQTDEEEEEEGEEAEVAAAAA